MSTSGSRPRPRPTAALLLAIGVFLLPTSALALCPAASAPAGYQLSGSCGPDAPPGATCSVQCATGYQGAPAPAEITCIGTEWSQDPSTVTGCAMVTCPAPTSSRPGYVFDEGCNSYGCSRAILCDVEHDYVGTPAVFTTTCSADGTWSPSPETNSGCEPPCEAMTSPPPGYTATCSGHRSGDSCAFACDTANGYAGTPSSPSSTCQHLVWSVSPESLTGCSPVACGAPASKTGYSSQCVGGHEYADTCAITCDSASGYIGTPSVSTITCAATGLWAPDPATNTGCAIAQCGPVAPPAGYTATCGGQSFGDSCTFACDAANGYEGTPSSSSASCLLDQTWSVSPASLTGCALHDCGPLTFTNADATACTARSRYGEGCTVSCLEGFMGTPTATCTMAGWERAGACTAEPDGRSCARPYELTLGTVATFALDDQLDSLSTGACTGYASSGRDVFLRAAVTAGDYKVAVDAGGSSAVQVVQLETCAPTACEPIALQGGAPSFEGAVQVTSDGTLLLAVHLLDPHAGSSASITLDRAPEPSGVGSGGGCSTGGAATSLLSMLAALAVPRRRGRGRACGFIAQETEVPSKPRERAAADQT